MSDFVQAPCDDCPSACCRGPSVRLADDELHLAHQTTSDGERRLLRRPDGWCVYFVAGVCSLHALGGPEAKPGECRRYTCVDGGLYKVVADERLLWQRLGELLDAPRDGTHVRMTDDQSYMRWLMPEDDPDISLLDLAAGDLPRFDGASARSV